MVYSFFSKLPRVLTRSRNAFEGNLDAEQKQRENRYFVSDDLILDDTI